jgi:hypothetical protein
MELDDLKHIWQTSQQREIYQQNVDNEKIMEMTRQKSKDLMSKLRKNLDFDIWINSLMIPPLIYVLFVKSIATYHKYIAGIFIVYTFAVIFHYWKEVNLFKKITLKNDLNSTLKFTLERFSYRVKSMKIYNKITIVPLMFYGSIVGSEIVKIRGHNHQLSIYELIFSTIIVTPIAYFYMDYIIKKLYGEHLEKLKQLLAELEQN